MTVPAAAAWIGVPAAAAMSMPGWNEQSPFGRQREPYGLAIGPCTGQMNPDDDGAGFPTDGDDDDGGDGAEGAGCAARARAAAAAAAAASAARILAPSDALWAWSNSDSCTN